PVGGSTINSNRAGSCHTILINGGISGSNALGQAQVIVDGADLGGAGVGQVGRVGIGADVSVLQSPGGGGTHESIGVGVQHAQILAVTLSKLIGVLLGVGQVGAGD